MLKNVYWSSGKKKKRRYSCQVVMKLEFSQQTFENFSNLKFHENPPSESRVVTCGRKDRRSDTTKLLVASRNFANVPETIQTSFALSLIVHLSANLNNDQLDAQMFVHLLQSSTCTCFEQYFAHPQEVKLY